MPKTAKTHKEDDAPSTIPRPREIDLPPESNFPAADFDPFQEDKPNPYTPTMAEDDPNFWLHRREIYRLPNGAVLAARNEVESSAYANKGGELVDVVYDE